MLPPLSLPDARELAGRNAWQVLADRGARLPLPAVLAEPELGVLYADACRRVGRTMAALEVGREIEKAARRTGRKHLVMNVTNIVGMALFEAGRIEDAGSSFVRLLDDASSWHDQEFSARAANNLGIISNIRGRRDDALSWYQRALAAYQALGHVRGLAQTHHNLGISYRDLGMLQDADTHHRHAIQLARVAGSEDVVALAELGRAAILTLAGDGELAEAIARRARHGFRRLGDPLGRAEALRILASAARATGRDELARKRLNAALAVARKHHDELLLAEVRRDQGFLLRDRGAHALAREALQDAAEHYERLGARAEALAIHQMIS